MEIKVLGPGCKNCVSLDQIAHQVIDELGLSASIVKVEDYAEIASYGVMSTPALILDGRVLLAGRVPTANHLKELITSAICADS